MCLLDDINGMVLNMKLTADGTDKFADYTKNNIGELKIVLFAFYFTKDSSIFFVSVITCKINIAENL